MFKMCKCQGNHILLFFKPQFVDVFFLQIAPKIDLYNHSQHSILKFKGLEVFQSFPESISSSDMRVYLMPLSGRFRQPPPILLSVRWGRNKLGMKPITINYPVHTKSTLTMSSAHTHKKGKMVVTQSCLTLCDPMDCSPPGSSVHGILQARILEWAAISFSRGSSQPKNRTHSPALQADSLLTEPPGKPCLRRQVAAYQAD